MRRVCLKAGVLLPWLILGTTSYVLAQEFDMGSELTDHMAHEIEVPSWVDHDTHTAGSVSDTSEEKEPPVSDPSEPDVAAAESEPPASDAAAEPEPPSSDAPADEVGAIANAGAPDTEPPVDVVSRGLAPVAEAVDEVKKVVADAIDKTVDAAVDTVNAAGEVDLVQTIVGDDETPGIMKQFSGASAVSAAWANGVVVVLVLAAFNLKGLLDGSS